MPKTPDEIEAMLGGWEYIDELKTKIKQLRQLLKRNKTGDCWCECGIGGNHSKLCIEIQETLEEK